MMKFLQDLDRWVIDHVFQQVVELTQCKPVRLAKQALKVALLLACVRYLAFQDNKVASTIALVVLTAWVGVVWGVCSHQTLFKMVGANRRLRLEITVLTLVAIIPTFFKLTPAEGVADLLVVLCVSCTYFFAACKEPKPREPRRKLTAVNPT